MQLKSTAHTILVTLLCSIAGCSLFVSWDDLSRSWIGKPVKEFIALNGPPADVREKNAGVSEYRFDLPKVGPGCVHYWLVDGLGVIVGYHYEGRCRPIG